MKTEPVDAAPGEGMAIQEGQRFIVAGDRRLRQLRQRAEKGGSVAQTTASELADHERVRQDLPLFQGFESPASRRRK